MLFLIVLYIYKYNILCILLWNWNILIKNNFRFGNLIFFRLRALPMYSAYFCSIFKTLCVEWHNSTLRFLSLPEREQKYLITPSGNCIHCRRLYIYICAAAPSLSFQNSHILEFSVYKIVLI